MLPRLCNGCKRLVIVSSLALVAALGQPALASENDCTAAPYRAFDFWLGEWEVIEADGEPAGRNEVTREQGGCLLVERWHGIQGGTGMSMNFYDPEVERWRQVWVSPGVQIDIAGGMRDGSMVMEGTILYLRDERVRAFRGIWTPLPDGGLRQFFEEADLQDAAAESPGAEPARAEGVHAEREWTPWFEGFYRRAREPDTSR